MTGARQSPRIDIVLDARGPADRLRRCVDSVRAHTHGDFRLLLVGAEPEERAAGFAAAANRAVAGSDADVVLVDPGMVATAGWLDALARCAASDPRIATVTAFSNAAGICSFPWFCRDDPWPAGRDPAPTLAALAAAAAATYPDPPVGTGPCLYVRRPALRTLGGFDPGFVTLRGTQADFCMRALRAHWRNTLADDAFVIRGDADDALEQANARDEATLALRHPYFDKVVGAFVTIDPLRPLREAALSRMLVAGTSRGVLHVIHDHGGGVETHVRALIEASPEGWRHCVATAVGDCWQVDEYPGDGARRRFEFVRRDGEPWHDFIGGIAASFRVSLIHIHHLLHARRRCRSPHSSRSACHGASRSTTSGSPVRRSPCRARMVAIAAV